LFYKDDYIKARLPMMPVIKGDKSTLNQIIIYSWLLVGISLALLVSAQVGLIYMIIALASGGLFLLKTYKAKRRMDEKNYRGLFGYSILYLFVLFAAIIIDGLI